MSQPPQMPSGVPFVDAVPIVVETFPPPPRRPGAVTALGVVSILFAIAEIVWAAVLGVIVIMFLFVYAVSGVARYSNAHQYTGGVYFPDGLPPAQTVKLTEVLSTLGQLSAARRGTLEALITKTGRTIAPTLVSSVPADEDIAKLVSDHGKTPEGSDFFDLREGRVELADDRATFEPEGTTQLIEATTAQTQPATVPTIEEDATPQPATQSFNPVQPRESVIAFAVIMSLLAAAWAILLFIAGICTLRDRRLAGAMHRWWAWIRLPLAVLGAIATALFFGSFPEADRTSTVPADPVDVVVWMILGAIPGVIAALYAIVVLLIVRTKSAKAWFSRP